jgi:tetratricopeptide (TPR) repeat protein
VRTAPSVPGCAYTLIVPRFSALILSSVFIFSVLAAQDTRKKPPGEQPAQEQAPPEEDTSLDVPKSYSFNPLQAEKERKIGEFYFKKGSFKAAANRFREATRWNPGEAEAYLRLGDAEEKLNDDRAAREAYAKYLELAPKGKEAPAVKKKLAQPPPPPPAAPSKK